MLQYCQAFFIFICLAPSESSCLVALCPVCWACAAPAQLCCCFVRPKTRNQSAAKPHDPNPTTQPTSLSPHLKQVSCNTPRSTGGAFKTSPKRFDKKKKKKSLKNMYKLQNIHENIMQTNAGSAYRSPILSPTLNPPLAAATHYDLHGGGKSERKVHCLPTQPPPLAVASCAQFSAFPFLSFFFFSFVEIFFFC